MASVTVLLTGFVDVGGSRPHIRWQGGFPVGSVFALDGFDLDITEIRLEYSDSFNGEVTISSSQFHNDRFTADFEATGRVIFTSSDGEVLEVSLATMAEPYIWIPTNSAEVSAFALHVRDLPGADPARFNTTLTLTDEHLPRHPSGSDAHRHRHHHYRRGHRPR